MKGSVQCLRASCSWRRELFKSVLRSWKTMYQLSDDILFWSLMKLYLSSQLCTYCFFPVHVSLAALCMFVSSLSSGLISSGKNGNNDQDIGFSVLCRVFINGLPPLSNPPSYPAINALAPNFHFLPISTINDWSINTSIFRGIFLFRSQS